MRGRDSNPVAGALLLTLLTASLLSFGSAASADWLVTTDGATVETRGGWEVRGRMVIFTSPTGVLSSLPLSSVDLEASEVHTQEMIRAAAGTPEAEEWMRTAFARVTDTDMEQAIGQLAKSIDTRVTGPRLSKTMKHRLTSLGIDEVDTALLSGVHAEHCAGLYYSVVPRERLVRTYCDYV